MIIKHKKIVLIFALIYIGLIWPMKIYQNIHKQNTLESTLNLEYDDKVEESSMQEATNNDSSNDDETANEETISEEIVVDLRGAVANPGIYHLPANSRIYELINQAGGFVDANISCINQATIISDESLIVIPSSNEECEEASNEGNDTSGDKVNINNASADELATLPGIGPSKAQDIVNYREENGRFTNIEDLQNVTGIGESTYSTIAEQISI